MKFDLNKFAARLKQASLKAELTNVPSLADFLRKRKTPIPKGTIQNHYYGVSEPPASSIAIYAEALGVSIDWLVTGKESQPMSITQLKEIIGNMIISAGGDIPVKDATLTEIDLLLARIEPSKREAILQFLRSMTPPESI
jgi:hypothetical protein